MWHAGLMGGGDDWYNVVLVTAPVGSEIEFDDGDEVVTAVGTGSQQAIAIHDPSSTYNITVSVNGYQETDTVTSTAVSGTVFIKEFKFAKITLTFDDDFRGLAVTLTDGTHVASPAPTLPATGNTADFYVPYYEVTYTFSATVSGILYTSKGVYVDSLDDECTETLNVRPDGKTVTPTDDIQKWLECAGINKPYTTLNEVLGDHESLQILMTDHNAVDYMVRSKTFINADVTPVLTSNTTPSGYEVKTSQTSVIWDRDPANAYKVWDGDDTTYYQIPDDTSAKPYYMECDLPSDITVKKITIRSKTGKSYVSTEAAYLQAYVNNDWVTVKQITVNNSNEVQTFDITPTVSSKWRLSGTLTQDGSSAQWWSPAVYYIKLYSADHGITEDETAMRYIGRRNYAANTLLADEDWMDGIRNSAYYASVMQSIIPDMQTNTDPEGLCFGSAGYDGATNWYRAFTLTNNPGSWSSVSGTGGEYIGYKFEDGPVRLYKVWATFDTWRANTTGYKFQGSNDSTNGSNGTWTDLYTGSVNLTSTEVVTFNIDDSTPYQWYRFIRTSVTGGQIQFYVGNIRFYGNTVTVDETKVMLYGANQDSFYYKDSSQQDVPLTTLSTTEKEISKSDLPLGEFKLYSSVAKNPDDLTADFCKTFKNDDNLIEVMMRPENTLYWYGYNKDIEAGSSANGWGITSGYSFSAPTFNTQNIQLSSAQNYQCFIGEKNLSNFDAYDIITQGTNEITENRVGVNRLLSSKNPLTTVISETLYNMTPYRSILRNTNKTNVYLAIQASNGQGVKCYGIYGANPNPACNLFSAAKDIVYYTENGVDIVVAETNEFGGAIVDFSKIPAGVTLYSSVAKDPDDPNLANPYSKIFSPVNGRFWLMPDNVVYWWGYTTETWARGYGASTSSIGILDIDKIRLKTVSTNTITMCTNNKIKVPQDADNLCIVWDRTETYNSQNSYNNLYMSDSGPGINSGYNQILIANIAGQTSQVKVDKGNVTSYRGNSYHIHTGVSTNTEPSSGDTYAIWFE